MKLPNLLRFASISLVLGGFAAAPLRANPGDLDSSFGTGGTVTTAIGSGSDGGYSMALQSDGKMVVAGFSFNGSNNDFALVRYHANGTLDSGFGSSGKVTTAIGSGDDAAYGVAVQSDGKILVAGSSFNGSDNDFALVRYNADGSLDSGFGMGGKVTTDFGGIDDVGRSVLVQGDGKIVVAGESSGSFAVVRYTASGGLDSIFGSGGKATTSMGGGIVHPPAHAVLQTDGKIVLAVDVCHDGTTDNLVMVRYNADGSLDTGFGSAGTVNTAIGKRIDSSGGAAIVVQGDGKLVVAGTHNQNNFLITFALARYNTDGTLDSGFGSAGTAFIGGRIANGVALQGDGKIVVTGSTISGSVSSTTLVRCNADGTLDTSFGNSGYVSTTIGSGSAGSSVAVQSDGKIVVAGSSSNGSDNDFALARYNVVSPTVTTDNASAVTTTDATLNGTVNPNGLATTAQFQYGLDTSYGSTATVTPDPGSGTSAVPVSVSITGLQPNQTYHFRVVAVNSGGTSNGPDNTFTTAAVAPEVTTSAATSITNNGATLNGFVNPNGATTTAHFELGLTTSYGDPIPVSPSPGSGSSPVAVSASINGLQANQTFHYRLVATNAGGTTFGADFTFTPTSGGGGPVNPPVDPPVYDTTSKTGDGSAFIDFGLPAVDSGVVGGAAVINANGRKQTIIYGDANGDVLAQTGGPDGSGATFTALGDPIFAGEALGFAATAELGSGSIPALSRVGFGEDERTFAVKPGGRVAALYSQLSRAGGIHRLAAQADSAPGGGKFARFPSFALPRQRTGLLYAALLHRDATVTARNDFGIWRERSDGSGTDRLLRTGDRGFHRTRGAGAVGDRGLMKVTFMPPVPNATDQRLSQAPDGGLAALAKFDDGSNGVVRVVADGSVDVPLELASGVPDNVGTADGSVEFVRFAPPATASGGRLALLAALKTAAKGQAAPPQAIFGNMSGPMQRVLTRGEAVPGLNDTHFGTLGQPLLGERGMIGLIASLTGPGAAGGKNKALVRIENGDKTVVARLHDAVPDYGPGVVFRKFMSLVVTDSDPGRIVFTALVGGPGVNGSNNVGVWSHTPTGGTKLVLRSGGTITASGQALTVRTFEALVAPKKSQGQGRSTDASGFVTAKAKLSDGRVGVLRIPLP